MKQFAMFAFLMILGTVAFAQKNTDPSVSANNYKHANKAAYAKKNNIDKSPELAMVTVTDNADYKHPARRAKASKKAELTVGTNSGATHKHPKGL